MSTLLLQIKHNGLGFPFSMYFSRHSFLVSASFEQDILFYQLKLLQMLHLEYLPQKKYEVFVFNLLTITHSLSEKNYIEHVHLSVFCFHQDPSEKTKLP